MRCSFHVPKGSKRHEKAVFVNKSDKSPTFPNNINNVKIIKLIKMIMSWGLQKHFGKGRERMKTARPEGHPNSDSLTFSCFQHLLAFSLCQELQGYVVVRVADQIGGGLETGCMIWTGAKHRARFVHCMDSVIASFEHVMELQNFCKNCFFTILNSFYTIVLSCFVSFVFICLLLCCLVPRALSLVSIISICLH